MRDLSDIIIANTFEDVTHEARVAALAKSSKLIEIICPYISAEGMKWLKENRNPETKVIIITELSIKGILSGSQSVTAISDLLNMGFEVYYSTSGLHAKIYWFDRKEILITSANMTGNGLRKNFEMGLSIGPQVLNENAIKGGYKSFNERMLAQIEFLKKQTEAVTFDILEKYRLLSECASDIRNQISIFEGEFSEKISEIPYISFQRKNLNKQNMTTDLMITNMFDGFQESDWEVFNHGFELSDENLTKFRYLLDENINPLLSKFYLQLKGDPVFKKNFSVLERGFSQNLLLRHRFPHDRYLYLTKPRPGKLARRHLGEPSIIIGMGKGDSQTGWLEVRSGVEEDTLPGLSVAGERLIRNLIKNPEVAVKHLNDLGSGWFLSHGSYSKRSSKYIDVLGISKSSLVQEIGHYPSTREVSDIQIRRKYFLSDKRDRELLLSPKITSAIAQDIQRLSYFFELANG